ncbi:hypothetical protein [Tatumella sp. UBA2305]|uniref:hypothetical protein n=1 Tax=Tatumella sp. UBA2305 TaxID=1947647 RepID=UPI0025DA5C30|nr:hypothetical protein [Tatumella sp. UBA2305]
MMTSTYAVQIEDILASGQRYLSDDIQSPERRGARDYEEYDDQGSAPELCFDE